MLRKPAEFVGMLGLGLLLGFSAATIAIACRPHAFYIYGAAKTDTRVLILIIVGSIIVIGTAAKAFASLRHIVTITDQTIGSVAFLLSAVPSVYFGYQFGLTLDANSPGVSDLLALAAESYQDGQTDPADVKGSFQPSSSNRLPQIE